MNTKKILKAIFRITGIDTKITVYETLYKLSYEESVIKVTQEEWLRKEGTERNELEGLHEDKAALLLPLFQEFGLYATQEPRNTFYTYGIVLGGELSAVIERFLFVENRLSQGLLRFTTIVLLTGERLLTAKEKTDLHDLYGITQELSYESDMMYALYKHTSLVQNLHVYPLILVNTPQHSSGTRPTTNDTVQYWLTHYAPAAGSCLIVSTNPLIAYQNAVCKTLLPASFTSETVGPLDPRLQHTTTRIAFILDSLARWLYQEHKRNQM